MSVNGHALVIGVSQYSRIHPLPPVADAAELARILRDPRACGYAPAHVTLVEESDATRLRILDELDRLAQRATGDATAIVYFSGHGGRLAGDRRESYLLPFDGAWGSEERLDATAIPGRLLAARLDAIRAARLLVILDCCHAAGIPHSKDVAVAAWLPQLGDDALARLGTGRGRVVMAASRSDGAAYVMTGARHGLFTEHLIAGLRGAASGPDGLVRVLDLYHHVQRNVIARQPAQRPVLKTELEDNFPVALLPSSTRPTVATRPPGDIAYDALIVHAPDERDAAWARSLVRQLEDRGMRVCIEDRDAALGGARVSEIERLVATSRFTLPVLTPRFAAGRFEALQATMAMHLGIEEGRVRLIPIVREPCEAQLGIRFLVSLDMIRDDSVGQRIERLLATLRNPPRPLR